MKVSIQEVRDRGPVDLEESIPSESLFPGPAGFPPAVPVRLKVHAESLGDEVLVLIKAETRAEFECARCLGRFERPIKATVELHTPLEVHEVDPGEEARQSLLLALPLKPLCRQDCKGLCARCGSNLNAGPCRCPAERFETPFSVLMSIKPSLPGGSKAPGQPGGDI